MKRAIVTIFVLGLVLNACGADAASDDPASSDASLAANLADSLITCEMPNYDGMQGITLTQTFAIIGGQAKRYSAFGNAVFDLCEPGQEGCSLEIDDGAIRMSYTSPNGVGSRYRVDPAALEIEAWGTEPGEAEREVPLDGGTQCRLDPLPEGLSID